MSAVEVQHLVKRYRGTTANAVEDVSFEAAAGQMFCLLGPNGAGKTTTISVLTTILAPSSGRVMVGGVDVAADPSGARRQMGIVFQGSALDLNLTAEENVRLHAVLYGLHPWRPSYRSMPQAYRRQVDDPAGLLGLGDDLGRPVRHLSGGTRRKLEILRALLHRPRVLFLDEPTSGLDPAIRRGLWAHLRTARSEQGTTVVLTSHHIDEAEDADQVCVMARGKVIGLGHPAELKRRHAGLGTTAGSGSTLEDAYFRLMAEAEA